MRPLLVVEDDALARAALVRFPRPFHVVSCANDVETALSSLSTQEPAGVLSDLSLEDHPAGGFEVLRAALQTHPGVPLAIVTGSCATSAINEAAAMGASYLAKPDYAVSALLPFLDLVAAREAGVGHLGRAISAAATTWGLTWRERQLVPWLVAGHHGKQICELAGYGQATYKTHVAALLKKSGCASTASVVIETYRIATGTRRHSGA